MNYSWPPCIKWLTIVYTLANLIVILEFYISKA